MELTNLNLTPYQQAVVESRARLTWNCWARQTGKSHALAMRRLKRALARGRTQIILSAGQRQSREVIEKVRMHCQTLRVYGELHETRFFRDTSIRQLEVRLDNGARIIGLPANPLTARGYTGDVFLDEFAMHRDDEAVWAALFPTLLREAGELDIASTPRGCGNTFYRLRSNPAFRHSTVTLEQAVGQGLDVDVAMMREMSGDELIWRQEFCCEFLDEATAFLTYDLIRQCQDVRLGTEVDWAVLDGRHAEVYAGVDIGRWHDLTAIWLWERVGDELITRGVVTLANTRFAEQEAVLRRILSKRAVRRCCIDRSGMGAQLAEELAGRFGEHRVESVAFTPATKSEMAGRLRVLVERGLVRIPVNEEIVNDWHGVSRVVTSAGHVRLDAPRSAGSHADRFWAAALGLHAANEDCGGPVEFQIAAPPVFARAGTW